MKYAVWKKAAVFLLAACMVLAFGGAAAFAEGEAGNVAQVNGTQYATLAQAVNAAPDGVETTVVLLDDIVMKTEDIVTVPAGKNILLDMKGHSITVESSFEGRPFVNYGTLTVTGEGTVDSSAGTLGYGSIDNYGVLCLKNGAYRGNLQAAGSNIWNRAGGTATFEGGTYTGCGTEIATQEGSTTYIKGGYYESPWYPAVENRGDMTISGGEFRNTSCSSCSDKWGYTVRSGESSSTAYLRFENGKVVGVQGGLAIAGGTADIYDGDFSTVSCVNDPAHTATSFYALYVAGESFENMATVYGGNFHAAYREAVHIGNSNPAPDSGAGKSSIVLIKGGTFTGGTLDGTAVVVENTDNAVGAASITGGTFSSDVSAYVPAGSAAVEDEKGNFIIAPAADACFAIGNVGYNTLAEAVAAVPADGTQVTITMLRDAQGGGVVVKEGQSIVFDFGGHTYNINGALVGSAGTESNGMQLLKGSAVTLKNGTLTSDKAKILVQNYCDLTLDGVKLDGTKSSVCGYVLSNNFGNTVATGDTCITAGEGKVAFDLYYNMSDAYKDGVTVTFDENFTGKVTGKIEYGAGNPVDGWEDKAALTIQGGTFDTQFAASGSNDIKQANISISGGSFTSKDAAGYVVPGFELKQNADGTFGVVKKTETPTQPQPQPSAPSGGQKANPKTGMPA